MAVSRYDNPARYTPVDDYVKFPIEFLVSALATKQKAYDETEGTNESSVKAVNEIITLDQVRTNTNNTETTTAVDKKLKQDFLEKINKDISQLTDDVNGDLSGSGASKRAKAIANEVNAFKSDFGVKAKTRYDNYNATIKQLETDKIDQSGVNQGIYNQVNTSLGTDFGDFDKSYTSQKHDYLDVEKSIQDAVSIAKADTTDAVSNMDVNQRAALAKQLGFRQGVVSESTLIEKLSEEKVKQTFSQYWDTKGEAVAKRTLEAQVYNTGRKFKNQEEYNKELEQIKNDQEKYALTGAYSKVQKTQTFNQDPNSGSGGRDADGGLNYLPSKEGDNIQLQRDLTGQYKELDIETVNQNLLDKDKKIEEFEEELAKYKNKEERPAKSLINSIAQLKTERLNEQLRAKTAQQSVIRTKLPEIIANSGFFDVNLKNTEVATTTISNGLNVLYGDNFRLPLEKNMVSSKGSWDEVQRGMKIREEDINKALKNPVFKKMWDEIGTEMVRKSSNKLTSVELRNKQNLYLRDLSDKVNKESGKILTKYANLVGQEAIIVGNVLDKSKKDEVSQLAKNEIATLGASVTFTKNAKGEHEINKHEFIPDNAVLGIDGEHVFFNTDVIGKDNEVTQKKKIYISNPSSALINSLVKSALAQPFDLLLNSRVSLLKNPILRELPLKPNGAVLPNGAKISGITMTPEFKKIHIDQIKSHPNPTSKDESLYTVNNDTEELAMTYQELCTIILHKQYEAQQAAQSK